MKEPLGMLFHIGMIRRAVDREIEGDFHASRTNLTDQPVEVVKRPKLRFDRFVATKLAADRVRHTGISLLTRDRVIFALPFGKPDRMNRRKIDHVEPHRFRIVNPAEAITELRSGVRLSFRGTRKEFVPSSEQCLRTVYDDRNIRLKLGPKVEVRPRHHQSAQFRVLGQLSAKVSIGTLKLFGKSK